MEQTHTCEDTCARADTHTHTRTQTTDVIPFHHLISPVSSKSCCLPGLLYSCTDERGMNGVEGETQMEREDREDDRM